MLQGLRTALRRSWRRFEKRTRRAAKERRTAETTPQPAPTKKAKAPANPDKDAYKQAIDELSRLSPKKRALILDMFSEKPPPRDEVQAPKKPKKDAHKEVIDALHALPPRERTLVIETVLDEALSGETPEGLRVTARSRKELRRLMREQHQEVIEWFKGFEAGEVFYDIGANVGRLTLLAAALHGERIRIVAFEPSFASFESLARNLSLNKLLGFTIPLQVALLDRTGLQPMNYCHTTAAGWSQHSIGEAKDYAGRAFTPVAVQMVPTYALDDLIEVLALPHPTRIKIDVDGHEEEVLRGATRTLAAGTIRELFIEVTNPDLTDTRLNSIANLLRGYGYEIVRTSEHPSHLEGGETLVADHLFRRRDSASAPSHSTKLQPAKR
jgi:FkbM family methyltransferase